MYNLEDEVKKIFKTYEFAVRKHDKTIPYWIHPLWCATMVLSEPRLDHDTRWRYALALLYHDAIEMGNRKDVPAKVLDLVEDMSFESFDEEMLLLMSKSDEVILLKLYDKVSNLLDSHWMTKKRHDEYLLHTMRLADFVENKYGNLQIVGLARILIERRNERF